MGNSSSQPDTQDRQLIAPRSDEQLAPFKGTVVRLTEHAIVRMKERGISEVQIQNAKDLGDRDFGRDGCTKNTHKGVVIITGGASVVTCYRDAPGTARLETPHLGDAFRRHEPALGKYCIATEEWFNVYFYVFDTAELANEAMKTGGSISRILYNADGDETPWRAGFNIDHASHNIRRGFKATASVPAWGSGVRYASRRDQPEVGKPCIATEEPGFKIYFHAFKNWELANEAMTHGGNTSRVLYYSNGVDTNRCGGFDAQNAACRIRCAYNDRLAERAVWVN